MERVKVIRIVEKMGFGIEYSCAQYIRFQLPKIKEYTWTWIFSENDSNNFQVGANILFKAGQKHQINKLNSIDSL